MGTIKKIKLLVTDFIRIKTYQIEIMTESDSYVMEISVPFPSPRLAEIAYNTLRVDKEPSRGGCKKMYRLEENSLIIKLTAPEAHTLRNASNASLDFLMLITETMKRFDTIGS